MPTLSQLLSTIDTTYRNTYLTTQKVEWIDATQRQIFQLVPKEAAPYTFNTIDGFDVYALPIDCDRFGLKQVTIENALGSGKYMTLAYKSIESNEAVSEGEHFYSVIESNLFLNPMPTGITEGKKVYLYYNKRPAALSAADLAAVPDLEEDFQELLILGCLERIARARGEIEDKNNFAADYNSLLQDYKNMFKLRQPEYYTPKMVQPFRSGKRCGSQRGAYCRVADLIPPGL